MMMSRGRDILGLSVVALAIFFALWPLRSTQAWPMGNDAFHTIMMTQQFSDAFSNGILYPRWLPKVQAGYGYPEFIFYQPMLFFLNLPLGVLKLPAGILFFVLYALAGAGAYRMFRPRGAATATLCAISYVLVPYMAANLYIRSDITEICAMAFIPWALDSVLRMAARCSQGGRAVWHCLGGGSFLAAVIYSHPAVALIFFPAYLVVGLGLAGNVEAAGRRKYLCLLAISALLGLALSAPYWANVFLHMKGVNLERAFSEGFSFRERVSCISELFWIPGKAYAEPITFCIGFPHALLCLLGMAVAWFRKERAFAILCFLLLFVLSFAMTTRGRFFTDHINLLQRIQFPFRILSVTAILEVICASYFFEFMARQFSRGKAAAAARPLLAWGAIGIALPCALVAVLWLQNMQCWPNPRLPLTGKTLAILDGWLEKKADPAELAYLDQEISTCGLNNQAMQDKWRFVIGSEMFLGQREKRLVMKQTSDVLGELTPITAKPLMLNAPRHEMIDSGDLYTAIALPDNTSYRIHYRINTREKQAAVVINQFYFPGWRVRVNNVDVPGEELARGIAPDGRLAVSLPPQSTLEIEAWYDGPPAWRWMLAGVLVVAAVLALGARYIDARAGR